MQPMNKDTYHLRQSQVIDGTVEVRLVAPEHKERDNRENNRENIRENIRGYIRRNINTQRVRWKVEQN